MVAMGFNRWVCRPRILGSVAVLSLAYYAVFMGGVPRQWKERFGRNGEAIDESLKAVLNETLGVSFGPFFELLFPHSELPLGSVTLGSFGKLLAKYFAVPETPGH